ncbi:hypothetical protein HHK36_000710 [Tetracentron sinense]|uniref:Aminotransferase class V domain-containing protein n=1 Tax=Tetracentron sinense TaxID=13715 RepID=A0A835DQY9_TETSI|nr:hypothetical protein HHK36_000710 [Tetracentron sinense]
MKSSGDWKVLIDAAKGCATQPPDLASFPADFVVISFYKIFGYPTGLGALLVRNVVILNFKRMCGKLGISFSFIRRAESDPSMATRGRGRGVRMNQTQKGEMMEMQQMIEQLTREVQNLQHREHAEAGMEVPEGNREPSNLPEGDSEEDSQEVFKENPFHGPANREQPKREGLKERLVRALGLNGGGVRIKVPDFNGRMHAEDFLDWEATLENYFEWKPMAEDHYTITLYEKFHGLRQRDLSMQDYTAEFNNLSMRVGLNETNEQLTTRYISGLRVAIRNEMRSIRVSNLEDAYQYALRAEERVSRLGHAAKLLKKTYFSGGTVAASIADIDFVRRRSDIEELFEDGTQSFLSIASIHHGFRIINALSISAIARSQVSSYPNPSLEVSSSELGPTVAFNLKRSDGSWVGYREVDKLASLSGIQLRTGCFCNPGACAKYLGLSHMDLLSNIEAGHVCWDDYDILNGKPTGAVRISFGYMSTFEDAKEHAVANPATQANDDDSMNEREDGNSSDESRAEIDRPMRRNERPQQWEDRIVRALQNAKVYGVQVQISDFDGETEAEDFLDWLDNLESYFDWKEVPEERKVKLVGAKLIGPASTWWKHYQNDREVRGKGNIRRWDKMKEKLKA